MAGALAALVVGEFASMMVYIANILHADFFTVLAAKYTVRVGAIMAISNVMTDTSLAITLVVLLRRRRKDIEFTTTSSVLKRLIQYVVGTSLVTVFVASLALACNTRWPNSFSYVALDFLAPKCK